MIKKLTLAFLMVVFLTTLTGCGNTEYRNATLDKWNAQKIDGGIGYYYRVNFNLPESKDELNARISNTDYLTLKNLETSKIYVSYTIDKESKKIDSINDIDVVVDEASGKVIEEIEGGN